MRRDAGAVRAVPELAHDLARWGEWRRAAETLWRAAEESMDAGGRWRLAGRAVSAALHAGDLALAQGMLRGADELPGPAFPSHVAAGAAMLALLVDGDVVTADRTIRTAIDTFDPLLEPHEVAELLAALHVVSLCRGDTGRPAASPQQALATFTALGSTTWARQARGDLGPTGDIAPPSAEPLTAQEARVAHLAAYGLSNKDIGQRLFLSPRTVSGHLYRLFPKLGITSRAGLRDALQRRDDATDRVMDAG